MSAVGDEFLALAKLRARQRDHAVLISRVLRVDPDPDAFILAPLKMTGEGRLWAAAYGRRGEDPDFVFAPDPRNRDDETALIVAPLARAIDDYFDECLARERAPQVWVSSGAAVAFLDGVSERRVSRDPAVALLGLRLHFLTDRYGYAGQQVLLSAVDALGQHFATGQSAVEDQHLGALLAWIETPPGASASEAAVSAEETPAGVVTDVEMDYELFDLLAEFSGLRKEEKKERRQREIALVVGDKLRPVNLCIWALVETAIAVIERQDLPAVPGMGTLRKSDLDAFDFYMKRDFVPLRSSADYAARQLADRESAVDRAVSVFLGHDLTQMALELEAGKVLEGTFTEFVFAEKGNSVHEAVVETDQAVSTLRIGDVVKVNSDKNIELQLMAQSLSGESANRKLRFRVVKGKTFLADLVDHDVTLMPTAGGGFAGYQRPPAQPWILDRKAARPGPGTRPVPDDPESALEVLA